MTLKPSQGIHVLFYVDTPSMLGSVKELAGHIVREPGNSVSIMVIDSPKYLDRSMDAYTVYDFINLHRHPEDIEPANRPARQRPVLAKAGQGFFRRFARNFVYDRAAFKSEGRVWLRHQRLLLRYRLSAFRSETRTKMRHWRNLTRYHIQPRISVIRVRMRHARQVWSGRMRRWWAAARFRAMLWRFQFARKAGVTRASLGIRYRKLKDVIYTSWLKAVTRLRHMAALVRYRYRRALGALYNSRSVVRLRERYPALWTALLVVAQSLGLIAASVLILARFGLLFMFSAFKVLQKGVSSAVDIARTPRSTDHQHKKRDRIMGNLLGVRPSFKAQWQNALSAVRLGLMLAVSVPAHLLFWLLRSIRMVAMFLASGLRAAIGHVRHGLRLVSVNFKRWFISSTVGSGVQSARKVRLYAQGVRNFLQHTKPDIIVTLEDNIQTYSRFFIEEGRRNGIPSVILPFTTPNPNEAAQYYKSNPDYMVRTLAQKQFARLFPHWQYSATGAPMLRLPVAEAAIQQALGYASAKPWVLNYGPAKAIAIESEAMRAVYLKLGFNGDQLKVVGEAAAAPMHETLTKRGQRRKNLLRRLRLQSTKRLIVCGFPPNQYGSSNADGFEFGSFNEMIERWMQAFSKVSETANVIVCPHPRLDIGLLKPYETASLKVVSMPTSEILPIADIYVACISATIRWAIACGIPVINYDCYRYRYDDYAGVAGVIGVEHLADFERELLRMTQEEHHYQAVVSEQRSAAPYWGCMDSGFGERFLAVLRESAAPQRPTNSAGLQLVH